MAKLKAVITDLGYASYEPERAELAAVGCEMVLENCSTPEQIAEACKDADGVLTRAAPVTAKAIAGMDKCRVIARYGVGVDNVDVEAATAKGIIVANVRGYCDEEVSDQAMALLLACVRKIALRDRQVRFGMWDIGAKDPIYRVAGKTLGLVGYGSIARTMHRKMKGFDLGSVLVFDPYVDAAAIRAAGGEKVELDELFKRADFISVHAPLTKETHHLIGAELLAKAKKTAILVNTSRGPLIDPAALYDALAGKKINSAGIDVHEPEPLPADSRFKKLDNIILTDHAGWYSEEAQLALQQTTARNVARVLSGQKPLYCVNPQVLK